jgi:hypothetical protein
MAREVHPQEMIYAFNHALTLILMGLTIDGLKVLKAIPTKTLTEYGLNRLDLLTQLLKKPVLEITTLGEHTLYQEIRGGKISPLSQSPRSLSLH